MATANYRIHLQKPMDSDIKTRSRFARFISVVASVAALVMVPVLLVGYWGSLLDHEVAGRLIGFIIGGIALANIAPSRMFVYNPEWRGYVTQDVIFGGMVPYGPGLHLSHWWEQRNAEGNYNLEVMGDPFSIKVTTTTATITINGQYERTIDLSLIERAIGTDPVSVGKEIESFIESFLIQWCFGKTAEQIRAAVKEMNQALAAEFVADDNPIRMAYGFKGTSIVINKIAFSDDAAKTRDAVDEAAVLFRVVANLYGLTEMELKSRIASNAITPEQYQKMLTRAMAVSDNATTMTVQVVEGLEGSPAGQTAAALSALNNQPGKGRK